MPDLRFAANIIPSADDVPRVLTLVRAAERSGLDMVTFQDHPYQPAFLDAWTLLSYAAAATTTIGLAGNVHPLPLRPPAMLAQAAASLDLLSGGRFELALGAGGFPEAIAAMGGRRHTPRDAVDALGEGIQIIRNAWDTRAAGDVRLRGRHYSVDGLDRGPAPAHDIAIWLGAYGPRMLRLVGRAANGWLPSLTRLRSLRDLADGNAVIDEAAVAAGRAPGDIARLLNLAAPAEPGQLAELASTYGISVFTVVTRSAHEVERLAGEIAPATRKLLA